MSSSPAADQPNSATKPTTTQPPHAAASMGPQPPPAGAVWMQYPAAAMVMQHQMMAAAAASGGPPQHFPPPPHYMAAYHPHHPYLPHHPPPSPHRHGFNQRNIQHGSNNNNNNNNSNSNNNSNNNSSNEGENNKTIWIGDLQNWMDESYLNTCFASAGEITSVKVIRNKQTGGSEGYGFVEFATHATAEKVLQSYAGMTMPNAEQSFRLNWATFSMSDKRVDNNGSDLSIFVGDLAADVTDTMLNELFATKYPSVKAAKVVIDANTGRSKGYGFVRFGDDNERTQAMSEMNGVYCSTRPMRIGAATPRKSVAYQGGYGSNGNSAHGSQSDGDSSNTTIFVGGLDPSVTDDELKQPFSQHGDIISVKIPVGKGCGFVQFANRSNAEEALSKLNGTVIGKQTVRLSWGRNLANKQSRGDYSNQWNGGYYGGHIYDGFGYMPHPHDAAMYAYGGYPVYGNQQQVS